MSIEAACACGARFRAEPHLYGKEVNCPTCGQKFKIPSPQPTKIAVQCSCGAKYQVASTMVGKRVQCQACKQGFVVGAAPSAPALDPFGSATADPFGGGAGDPLGGLGSMDFPGVGQPAGGATPFGAPGMGVPGYGAPTGPVAPFQPSYSASPGGQARPGAAGKTVLKVLVIGAIVLIGLIAVGGGGWIAFSLLGGGYSSPEAVFAAAQEAQRNKDYKTLYKTLSPDTQNQVVGLMAFAAVMGMQREPGLADILKNHGINADEFRTKHNVSMSNPLALLSLNGESFKNMSNSVPNKAAFFGDCARLAEEKRAAQGQSPGLAIPGMGDGSSETLMNVVIDGDQATGKQTISAAGRNTERTVQFRRVSGRWYIHAPMDLASAMNMRK